MKAIKKLITLCFCSKPVRAKGLCNYHYSKEYYSRPGNVGKYAASRARYVKTEGFRQTIKKNHLRPKTRFGNARRNALKRHISWSLTFEQWHALILNKVCDYCSTDAMPTMGCALDRMDNAKGYQLDNVVPCCARCNKLKNDCFTPEEFRVMLTALNEWRKNKS